MRKRLAAAGASLALLAGGLYVWSRSGARFAPEAAEVAALHQRLLALQQEFEDLSSTSKELPFASAPREGLVIGVPTSVARDVAQQIIAGYLGDVRLTLRDKRVKTKRDDVEARVLFARRTVGTYELQTRILKVTAALRPRQLHVGFEGQRLEFNLPVSVADGRGRAQLDLTWDSKGIADLVCGDAEISRELEGRVIPAVYPMSGHFDVAADGGSLVLRPRFTNSRIRVRIEASEEAWSAFDALVEDRNRLCRHALKKGDVRGQLAALLAEGFDVRLPNCLLRDIVLPARVQESLTLTDGPYLLKVSPARVEMNARWLWYGTSVSIERAPADPGPLASE